MTNRPNLFIAGAPKTGTTSLYGYLDGHPDVFMSPVKEPMYFAVDMRGGPRRRFVYPEDEAEYLALFAGARGEKVLGEASTRYLASPAAPSLIHDFNPGASIVAMLRNPVDMLEALHNERVSFGTEDILDFELALDADQDRLAGRRLRPGADPLWGAYRHWGMYGEQLARWLSVFDSAQMHVVVFDDFVADTPREFERLLEFLRVDQTYRPASFAPRRQRHQRRRGVLRAVVDTPLARWTAHRLLPAVLGRTGSTHLVWRFRQSRLNLQERSRVPIRPELRRQLEDEFRPDVERLSEILGRDFVDLWFGAAAAPPRPVDAAA